MADVASKEQTTALFLSPIVTRTRRHTELKKKLTHLMGNLCCAREHSVQFFRAVFYTVLDWNDLAQDSDKRRVLGEHGNLSSGSIQYGEFLA
jgi:hypothetical protein